MTRITPTNAASALLRRFGVEAPPVPVERIAKMLKVSVRYSPLDDEISGMIYIQDGEPIIGINALHHPNRQRFSIAHELGHLQLHRHLLAGTVHVDKQFRMPVLRRDGLSATGTERVEIEANQFAAELLMPRIFLEREMRADQIDIASESPLDQLSRRFGVSKQALENRLMNLSLR